MHNKMIQTNNGNFHKGFYENGKENIRTQLQKIKNLNLTEELENMECVYYDADIFLHGICHIFAFVLHQKFGYDIFELKNETMIHWCCISDYNGKETYIDVRGATTDYDEFLWEFQTYNEQKPSKTKIINLTDYDDEWEEVGLKFANEIITKYYDYYSLY